MKEMHFKNREAYRKWSAYGHIHTKTGLKVSAKKGRKSVFESTPGNTKVVIAGRKHVVKHRR